MYCQLIGSLMYLFNARPDICFAVNTLSQFMMEPGRVHYVAAKHVLRYLQGTVDYGLDYVKCDGVRLIGCTNSDYVGNASDGKSNFWVLFLIGLSSCVMVQRETKVNGIEQRKGRVYGS